jgi:hypothetical protein
MSKCAVCRKSLQPTRADAKTCSPRCRQKAYRKRLSVTKTVTGNVRFFSQADLWATPQWSYDKLDLEFHFTVDLCAAPLTSVDCGYSDAEFLFSYDAC